MGSSLANDSRTFIVREINILNILQGEFCIGFDGDLQVLLLSVALDGSLSADCKRWAFVGVKVYFCRCLFNIDSYCMYLSDRNGYISIQLLVRNCFRLCSPGRCRPLSNIHPAGWLPNSFHRHRWLSAWDNNREYLH